MQNLLFTFYFLVLDNMWHATRVSVIYGPFYITEAIGYSLLMFCNPDAAHSKGGIVSISGIFLKSSSI